MDGDIGERADPLTTSETIGGVSKSNSLPHRYKNIGFLSRGTTCAVYQLPVMN